MGSEVRAGAFGRNGRKQVPQFERARFLVPTLDLACAPWCTEAFGALSHTNAVCADGEHDEIREVSEDIFLRRILRK